METYYKILTNLHKSMEQHSSLIYIKTATYLMILRNEASCK